MRLLERYEVSQQHTEAGYLGTGRIFSFSAVRILLPANLEEGHDGKGAEPVCTRRQGQVAGVTDAAGDFRYNMGSTPSYTHGHCAALGEAPDSRSMYKLGATTLG